MTHAEADELTTPLNRWPSWMLSVTVDAFAAPATPGNAVTTPAARTAALIIPRAPMRLPIALPPSATRRRPAPFVIAYLTPIVPPPRFCGERQDGRARDTVPAHRA